jgi:hypothetical protein
MLTLLLRTCGAKLQLPVPTHARGELVVLKSINKGVDVTTRLAKDFLWIWGHFFFSSVLQTNACSRPLTSFSRFCIFLARGDHLYGYCIVLQVYNFIMKFKEQFYRLRLVHQRTQG